MKGITQPSEGHVKSRPRSSSGSPTKIESRFIIRKVHFYSLRDKKRENHGSYEDVKGKSGVQGPACPRFLVFMNHCDPI